MTPPAAPTLFSSLLIAERSAILSALRASGGNVTAAARSLSVSYRHLNRRILDLGLTAERQGRGRQGKDRPGA